MPTLMINFMLSLVENKKIFYSLGSSLGTCSKFSRKIYHEPTEIRQSLIIQIELIVKQINSVEDDNQGIALLIFP